jgi:DNA polymerase I-like protein with 3'-5' exonuclease and polymerase domains
MTPTHTIDIETNMAHDTIWCAVVECIETGSIVVYADWDVYPHVKMEMEEMFPEWKCVDKYWMTLGLMGSIGGHNAVGFDFPVLKREWGVHVEREQMHDSLLMSRMWNCNIDGGHSLKAWGERLKKHGGPETGKLEYDNHDEPLCVEKIIYCVHDVQLTSRVFKFLDTQMTCMGFSDESIELERDVAFFTKMQEDAGFYFDYNKAQELYCELYSRQVEIEEELQQLFPPIVHKRVSEKTGKPLKDVIENFNPGSRPQIARRLEEKGVTWTRFTEKGNVIVDETTLAAHVEDVPEAALMLEYLKSGKLASMVKGWLDHYSADDHRIHGRVNTVGAVTGRMTHSGPNVAQVDKDKRSRSCWTVPEGKKLVGADASGLELRMFAHYINSQEYIDTILNGDIHTYNQEAAGLPTRDDAKTFIYAMLYGAGLGKIGSIVGGSVNRGRELKENFTNSLPEYEELCDKIARIAQQGHLPGLDGRRLRVRHAHAALNTLLQGAGAIVMKKAMVIAMREFESRGWLASGQVKLVAQVHDEFQVEADEDIAFIVGALLTESITMAGRDLGVRCPLDGEYIIGNNWSETH